MTTAEYAELTWEERCAYAYFTGCVALAEANYAASAGAFTHDHRITRMAMSVDAEGWSEVSELLDRTSDELDLIRQTVRTRLANSDEKGKTLLAFTTMFEVPASSSQGIVRTALADLRNREDERREG
jgi:hypothetical protein